MKETVENNRTGFLHILPPWIFLAILFASLDLFLRLKALAFVSTVEWLYYLVKVYGIYLLTILFSCILLTFIIRGIKALIPTTFDIQRISLALFISCVFAFIIISETEISITIQSTAKFIGLIVTCIGSAALGMLLSKFIIRFSSLFWVSSIVILLLPSAIYLTSTYDHRHIPDLRQRPSSCPNVLLILIDTLRADHVGCYDQQSPTLTPNMDNFAEDAAIFMDVTSQSSWTKTSVASLMTSQYPSNHGVLAKEDILDSDIPILSSLLRESGILTAAFVGNPWIYPTFGFDRGFSYYFNDFYQLRRVFFLDKMYRREWLRRAPYPDGAKLLNFARQWIEDNRGHPFFVYLHIMDVHDPYIPPPPFDRMYLPAEYKQLKRDDLKAKELEFRKSESPSDSTHLPLVEALYDGGVSYTDSILGEFLDFLDDAGLKDSSLIIITSDHGEEFLEHNGTTHGKTLYEEVLKIPLIMSFPGILSGGIIVDEPVTLIDVVPTIIDILEIESPFITDGTSLKRFFLGANEGRDMREEVPVVSELLFRGPFIQSVKSGDWKLILTRKTAEEETETHYELYELGEDPGETRNLINSKMEIAATLSSYLPLGARQQGPKAAIPDELEDQLRLLGYITK